MDESPLDYANVRAFEAPYVKYAEVTTELIKYRSREPPSRWRDRNEFVAGHTMHTKTFVAYKHSDFMQT